MERRKKEDNACFSYQSCDFERWYDSGHVTGSLRFYFATSFHAFTSKPKETQPNLRRALSDSDIVRSVHRVPVGSWGFWAGIPEEQCVSDDEVDRKFRALVTGNGSDKKSSSPEVRISKEEIGHSGDGVGNSGKTGGIHGNDSYGHKIQIGDYYREMLRLNPADSLLLRNYGRFLHEPFNLSQSDPHFMWEAEEDDNEEDETGDKFGFSPPIIPAF
ncbi:Detected protein of unknown function [Hibiscus syriacus]|uniref:Uncharacterized protein n=1 Tax=Hibiscus syriacus TaxID=106335 RepID=A0A6A3C5D0_HIBSY|nr:Detected protein of unknown function [Hibiscus syriacus]